MELVELKGGTGGTLVELKPKTGHILGYTQENNAEQQQSIGKTNGKRGAVQHG